MSTGFAPLYVALVHYPVFNRKGEVIASAITNLDLHDLARTCCTFDIPVCYIVTPLKDQQLLSRRVVNHWLEGIGRELQPDRTEALRRLSVVESIESAKLDITGRTGRKPVVWATTANMQDSALSHPAARERLRRGSDPHLLLLGTGWGFAPSVFDGVDAVLDPIRGKNGFNHLPVRSAAAILIDRLLGET